LYFLRNMAVCDLRDLTGVMTLTRPTQYLIILPCAFEYSQIFRNNYVHTNGYSFCIHKTRKTQLPIALQNLTLFSKKHQRQFCSAKESNSKSISKLFTHTRPSAFAEGFVTYTQKITSNFFFFIFYLYKKRELFLRIQYAHPRTEPEIIAQIIRAFIQITLNI